MTKHEFLYDHDLDSIIDLINREVNFINGAEGDNKETQPSTEPVRATEFL